MGEHPLKPAAYTGRRDIRFVTLRRGGTLPDAHHRLLAAWAADCAAHVLALFSAQWPQDDRPRRAIEQARAWSRGECSLAEARAAAVAAHAAARAASGPAREAARAAGHAAATAHMADHELGASAYAIRAVRAVAPPGDADAAGHAEREWQRAQLPEDIRDLVLSDQELRNRKLWSLYLP